jgi:hypothetical protein
MERSILTDVRNRYRDQSRKSHGHHRQFHLLLSRKAKTAREMGFGEGTLTLGESVRSARACHVVDFYDDLAKWTAIEVIDGIG